jgi:hypothetical protein
MRTLAQLACHAALLSFCAPSFAGELGGAGWLPAHAKPAPLAAIMARAQLRGMRLREVRWDAVLKQNWAVLEDVQHPEYPLWSERMDTVGPVELVDGTTVVARPAESVAPPKPYLALVHYGDRVRLWKIERNVRMEMSAIAEGSAAIGEEVKLRIPSSGVDGDTGWRVVGIVHGPGDVEMTQ